MYEERPSVKLPTKRIVAIIFIVIAAIFVLASASSIWETCDLGFFHVKQAAVTGEMTVRLEPGLYWQNFGNIHEYKVADMFYFSNEEDEGSTADESIPVRFNDGGTGRVIGSVRVTVPSSVEKMVGLHTKFRGHNNLIREGVDPLITEAVMLTAALMSAEDSYKQRALFSQYADDQVSLGVYMTKASTVESIDPISGDKTTKQIVEILRDDEGNPIRKKPPLTGYGVALDQFVIKDIVYEKGVEQQIAKRRDATMQATVAKANAEKAQQDTLTAIEEGKKNVAVAQYKKEEEKIMAVTEAQKRLEVAKLDKQAAEQYKQEKILKAEGDSEYARKLIQADGALDKKLKTYEAVSQMYANAMANYNGAWVPAYVAGGSGGGNVNGAQAMIDLLTVKTAKDLGLDLSIKKGAQQ